MHINIDRIFTTVSRNLGLKEWSKHLDSWIEWTYEAERLIGSIDTFVTREATYTTEGAKATGKITFTANSNPIDGDSIELNGTVLYFRKTSGTAASGGVTALNSNEIRLYPSPLNNLGNTFLQVGGVKRALISDQSSMGVAAGAKVYYPETVGLATYELATSSGATLDVNTTEECVINITAKEIGQQGNDFTISCDAGNRIKTDGFNLTGGKGIYNNQQLRLPNNLVKLLAVRVGEDDSQFKNAEILKISSVHRSRVGKIENSSEQKALRYYVDGNRLNIAHDDLDEITIVYLAYPTDMRGWPMVKEGHETAVAQYIMWQMKLIEFYNGQLPQYITKELERRWYQLCAKARGDDAMPTPEELKQIGKLWNTLVPLKSNNGLIDL
jgi:hypothetical protein